MLETSKRVCRHSLQANTTGGCVELAAGSLVVAAAAGVGVGPGCVLVALETPDEAARDEREAFAAFPDVSTCGAGAGAGAGARLGSGPADEPFLDLDFAFEP